MAHEDDLNINNDPSTMKVNSVTSESPSDDVEFMKDDIQIPEDIKLPEETKASNIKSSQVAKPTSKDKDSKDQILGESSKKNAQEDSYKENSSKHTFGIGVTKPSSSQLDPDSETEKLKAANELENHEEIESKKADLVPEDKQVSNLSSSADGASEKKTQPVEDPSNNSKTEKKAEKKPKKKGPAHAAPPKDSKESKDDSSESDEGSQKKTIQVKSSRKGLKRLLVACVSCVGVLGISYFVGAFIFKDHVLPNTFIGDESISMYTKPELENLANEAVSSYTLDIEGQGVDMTLRSTDLGLRSDSAQFANSVLSSQNAWLWPVQILQSRDDKDILSKSLSADNIEASIVEPINTANQSADTPHNAYIAFDPERLDFYIEPEVAGSILNSEAVGKAAKEAAINLDADLSIDETFLQEPNIMSDDPRLKSLMDDASTLIKTPLELTLGGDTAEVIDASVMGPWMTFSEDMQMTADPALISQWADSVSSKFNTVGKARTYVRPDGKTVNVSGGTYGWSVDKNSLIEQVNNALASDVSTVEIPATQAGVGYDSGDGKDWGERYIDIDLAEQHARFYDASGNLVWESAIVSGAYGKNDTPTGVYKLNNKATNMTLRGPLRDGVYEWESQVSYWMAFKGSSFGLHDANWQSAFGGTRYKQGFGSHGCVNLPFSAAQALFGMIEVGDVVSVHY